MGRPVKGMREFHSRERAAIRLSLIEQYGMVCQLCKRGIDDVFTNRHPLAFSIDHITALADGGTNTRDNMWPTHAGCNNRKGSEADKRNHKRPSRNRVTQTTQPRLAYSSSSY